MSYFDFFEKKGFIYSDELLTNFALSLKTKPFTILSGISGSGKSKIAQIFSEYMTEGRKEQFEFMSVKPNWKDSKDLLGYFNVITGEYEMTPFLKLLIQAKLRPNKPFFLLLDEMNLAKVEHYFSDFLSCIESRYYPNKKISLIPSENQLKARLNALYTKTPTLSEVIVLSALDLREKGILVHSEHQKIEVYRKNFFINWWFEKYSSSNNPVVQVRSELNQGQNRLAHRLFEALPGGKSYRLKEEGELNTADLATFKDIENKFYQLTKLAIVTSKLITQEPMILHSKDAELISTNANSHSKTVSNSLNASELYDATTSTYFIPSQLHIPMNVFVIGTVNIDETTYLFSPKVLDRANLIEFNQVDVDSIFNISPVNNSHQFKLKGKPSIIPLEIATVNTAKNIVKSDPDVMADLLQIFNILEKYNLHFGYRVINEVALYISNSKQGITDYPNLVTDALDIQLLQKVLPKFNGSIQKLWDPFTEILSHIRISKVAPLNDEQVQSIADQLFSKDLIETTLDDYKNVFKYPRTAKKLLNLLRNLENNGFTSFIE